MKYKFNVGDFVVIDYLGENTEQVVSGKYLGKVTNFIEVENWRGKGITVREYDIKVLYSSVGDTKFVSGTVRTPYVKDGSEYIQKKIEELQNNIDKLKKVQEVEGLK